MANNVSSVGFAAPPDYTLEAQRIERQRKLAEALQTQGMQPLGNTEMVGGFAVPKSPMEGVGKLAQSLSGAYQQHTLDARQKELAAQQRAQGNQDAESFMTALNGTPAQPERAPTVANDDEGNPMPQIPAQEAVAGDKKRALAIALQSQNPMVAGAGQSMLSSMLKPGAVKYQDAGDRILVLDETGKQVGTFSKGTTPDAALKDKTTRSKNDVAPSGVVFNPYQTQPGQVFNDPNKLINLDSNNKAVVNQPLFGAKEALARASKPTTQNTIINAGPKAFEMELGKLDAEKLGEWRKNAEAGQSAMNTVSNLRAAIAQGVYSGGGANLKTDAANIVNGLTGATTKNLPGSQLFNAEASKLLLDNIKALGTNPSNADRDFLSKTIPNISHSPQARDQLLDYMEKKATQSMDLYQRADSHARANHGLGGFNPLQTSARPDRRETPRAPGGRVVVDY